MATGSEGRVRGLLTMTALWVAATVWVPGVAAQVRSASPTVSGTAYNSTAFVRAYGSVGGNPAGLGMPGTPPWSFALPAVGLRRTLGPVSLAEVNEFAGAVLPASRRHAWLERIEAVGGQAGGGGVEVTGLAANAGRLGFQHTTVAVGDALLNPDAAELVLFGNAGRTGEARDFVLEGSRMDASLFSTFSVALGQPLPLRVSGHEDEALAVGVTLRYVVGHVLVLGRDLGGRVGSDPLEVSLEFPLIVTDSEAAGPWDRGSGVAVDVGAGWEGGPWAAAVVLRNALNTFAWDPAALKMRPGSAQFDEDGSRSDFEVVPFEEAPAPLRDEVERLGFAPTLVLSAGYRASANLSVSADLRRELGEGIAMGPDTHLGAGVEFRPHPRLPLRGGLAYISDGMRAGGGLGLALPPIHLGVSAMYESGPVAGGSHLALTLSVGAP
jgi:hypothetical protein